MPRNGYTLVGSLLVLVVGASALLGSGSRSRAANVAVAIVEPSTDPQSWRYEPATLTVALGDTIVWTNEGVVPHTVTSTNNVFDSGNMDHDETFTWAPTAAGTYTYICLYHPWMVGTVVVTP
ncbi:MAG TPA: plastocyanin/azurin family copper-binding protein [Chloroflexota bacterium]|nr:plastocyanin/azurin family copper-binding protein [Gemmatimonadales bacterium]HZU04690.1 plastocyanin/azurin family copper-binding protein [Chloroflexota bacterium]